MECLVERVFIDICYLISYHKQRFLKKNKQWNKGKDFKPDEDMI
jgi:hypothetical protein